MDMKTLIKKSSDYIKFMNESNHSDEEKKARTKDYVASLKGEPMSDDAKKRFVKDTVGSPDDWKKQMGYVKQAKDIIRDDKEKRAEPTKKMISPILGKDKSSSFKDKLTSNKLHESDQLQKQTLASSMESIRVEYAKGIVRSIKLYDNLIEKSRGQYGIDDLSQKLESHIVEDNKELEKVLNILSKADREEVTKYQKEINKEDESESEIDLSDEITDDEEKKLSKEKDIDEKNEVTEDDTSFGASDLMSKYVNESAKGRNIYTLDGLIAFYEAEYKHYMSKPSFFKNVDEAVKKADKKIGELIIVFPIKKSNGIIASCVDYQQIGWVLRDLEAMGMSDYKLMNVNWIGFSNYWGEEFKDKIYSWAEGEGFNEGNNGAVKKFKVLFISQSGEDKVEEIVEAVDEEDATIKIIDGADVPRESVLSVIEIK
jgi:hypothetical protein